MTIPSSRISITQDNCDIYRKSGKHGMYEVKNKPINNAH